MPTFAQGSESDLIVNLTRLHRQHQVMRWCRETFGDELSTVRARAMRFLEEAIEACQAAGVESAAAEQLLAHVYARPAGDVAREIGACGVSLLAFAEASGVDADVAEACEFRRVREVDHTASLARKRAAGLL